MSKRTQYFFWVVKNIEEVISCTALLLLTIAVIIQVFFQFISSVEFFRFDGTIPDWPEEVSLALMIMSIYIGCGFVMKHNHHLSVTILPTILSSSFQKILSILVLFITMLFCFYISYLGFLKLNSLLALKQKTFALEISVFWYYLSIPIGIMLMGIRSIEKIIQTFMNHEFEQKLSDY